MMENNEMSLKLLRQLS